MNIRHTSEQEAFGGTGARGRAYSFFAYLGHLTIDHASVSRRNTVIRGLGYGVPSLACSMHARRPSPPHSHNAGTEHTGFSPTRQKLLAPSAVGGGVESGAGEVNARPEEVVRKRAYGTAEVNRFVFLGGASLEKSFTSPKETILTNKLKVQNPTIKKTKSSPTFTKRSWMD